jgi:hypothetical protein
VCGVSQALSELVEQARNVVDAHERRADGYSGLTLREAGEIGELRIRLDALADAQSTERAEAS